MKIAWVRSCLTLTFRLREKIEETEEHSYSSLSISIYKYDLTLKCSLFPSSPFFFSALSSLRLPTRSRYSPGRLLTVHLRPPEIFIYRHLISSRSSLSLSIFYLSLYIFSYLLYKLASDLLHISQDSRHWSLFRAIFVKICSYCLLFHMYSGSWKYR